MKHVVFLKSRASFRGGLEKYTCQLLQAFARQGCKTTLLTTGNAPIIKDVEVVSLAPNSKFSLYQLLSFDLLCKRWLKKHSCDVIFGMERTTQQTHYRAGNGVHAVYLKRRQLIEPFFKRLTLSLNPLHRTILSMEKRTFESPELKILFTNSHMVQQEILQNYHTPPEKIEVVHNGVEWEKLSHDFEQTFPRRDEHGFHFIFVGNGYKRKGLLFLLDGLHLLNNKDAFLTVIGREKNPAYFEQYAEKLGLTKRVKFLGPQKDMNPFYRSADVLVIPSIYDPFANVTVEALAMGLFVVSSTYNGGAEILKEHSGTVIEELTSAESVANALKKAFDKPKSEQSARMIRQSIKELDFSCQLDKIVSKTLKTI